MQPPIHFYFDFLSPFGYFAARQIDDLARRHGRGCDWHAMLLGVSVLKVMGLKPLLDTPLKGDYLARDAARHARREGLALARPLHAPPGITLPAARAFPWLKRHHPDIYKPIARALLDAYWLERRDLDADFVAGTAGRFGVDAAACRAAIDGEGRELLRAAVDESLAKGVFGSPFILIDGEPFWGVETLGLAEDWLRTGGW